MTKIEATIKWCNISNAINAKYKAMIDQCKEAEASKELDQIKNALINLNFLKKKTLKAKNPWKMGWQLE